MKHQTSAALYGYWLSCHGDAAVRAGGVDAAELAPLLPDLFLVDLTPDQNARVRFCGAAIALRYGRDLADESFLALWNHDDKLSLERDLKAMVKHSTGVVAGVMGETMGGGFIAYEMLMLPLVGAGGGAGALGSMARVGGHDDRNRVRSRITAQSLRSIRFLPPAAEPARLSPARAFGGLPREPLKTERRYRHLTVVTGGR